jgi:putative sterol carrier protein
MLSERKVSKIVEASNGHDAVRALLKGWDRVVRLSLDRDTCDIVLRDGQAELRTVPERKFDLSFALSDETLDALLDGKVTPIGAKLAGKIRSSGSIVDVLRFAAILSAAVKAIRSAP